MQTPMCFREDEAKLSLHAHEKGLEGLIDLSPSGHHLDAPCVERKTARQRSIRASRTAVRPLHRKQYFPNEPGWFESKWYSGDRSGFEVAEVMGIKVGYAVCTEAMFNERARAYGKARGFPHRHTSRVGDEHRVVENRGSDGVDRVGRLRCELEPGRPFQKWYAVWRRRFRLCSAREFAR